MKIILRKRDSVVSIVLFLFNIFGEYTGKHSIKLEHLIKSMGHFDKNETAARMGLSRMVKAGILINRKAGNEVYYSLTDSGLQNIKAWNLGIARFLHRYALRKALWDGKWHLLTLLKNTRSGEELLFNSDNFLEIGLRQLNRDLWISPYYYEEISNLLDGKLEYLEFAGEVAVNRASQDLLVSIFEISEVRKQYEQFLALCQKIRIDLAAISDPGEHLPLLFNLGWNFYDIAVNDPALPESLLKNWIGDQAASEMQSLRKLLYDKAAEYFSGLIKIN